MRIAIVNDLRIAAEALRRVVQSTPGLEVAWIAGDGAEAVEKAKRDCPDLILMDLLMPRLDGAEATRQIMASCPCPILVVTSSVTGNIGKVYEALGHGALDAVDTTTLGTEGQLQGGDRLVRKISQLKRLLPGSPPVQDHRSSQTPARAADPKDAQTLPPLLLLGASTGGPAVLSRILAALPISFPAATIVVQHVDEAFSAGLAAWLSETAKKPVMMALGGCRPTLGAIVVAHSREHIVIMPDRRLRYTAEPADVPYRPSVDVLFESAARCWPVPGVAVLLTGMGRDGAKGLLRLREAGWFTIAQDQRSSTVWGMPKAAVELNAACAVLPPADIPGAILNRIRTRPSAGNTKL